jgi:hypothetical protein
VARCITWPRREAAELPDAQRLRALERLTGPPGDRRAVRPAPAADRSRSGHPAVRGAAGLGARGSPCRLDAATAWIATPSVPVGRPQFGLEVLREVPTLTEGARQAIELALRDPDAAVRISALDTLERHDATPSLPAVLSALDDDSREVRLRASGCRRQARPAHRAAAAHARRGRRPPGPRRGDPRARVSPARDAGAAAAADRPGRGRAQRRDRRAGRPARRGGGPALVALARRRPADDAARRAQLALGKVGVAGGDRGADRADAAPPVSAETRAALRAAGAARFPASCASWRAARPAARRSRAAILGEIGDRRATAPLCEALERRAELAPVALGRARADRRSRRDPDAGARAESSDLETAGAATRRCSRCAMRARR